jgi:hypothetical protein
MGPDLVVYGMSALNSHAGLFVHRCFLTFNPVSLLFRPRLGFPLVPCVRMRTRAFEGLGILTRSEIASIAMIQLLLDINFLL